ncbi:LPXTG cell wall anchor domain-containing protein [Streptomyces roseoviridis]|uniref:LPXTG cell wall anchor domain-containing protein n=1 Tax=Streptomyces roseoviridis TaxID=67361 RepID=A0ABV5QJ89_9ACTN
MKIRRILATAVAAAVTTPVVLLSAAPAFADTKPAAPAQTQDQNQTVEDLRRAVTKAQAAYDAAVIAEAKALEAVEALDKADHPLKKAAADAQKASEEAAAAKVLADQKLADAKKALAELPADAPAEKKTEAEKAVTDAQAVADTAKTTAETKAAEAKTAQKTYDDASVAAFTVLNSAKKAKKDAAAALDAAKKALDEALEELPGEDVDCKDDKNLVTSITGPKKVTAGTSGVFTFRITNKGKTELGEVGGYAEVFDISEDTSKHLTLAWSSATSPKWQTLGVGDDFSSLSSLKPGKSFDVKLKVTVGAKAPAGDGFLFGAAGYVNKDGSCGSDEEGSYAEFGIVKPGKPTKPGTGSTGGNGNTSPQGGQSNTAVTGGTTGSTTGGNLANTGAGSATTSIALAAGAAVVLGAGAMVVVRRRKAGADA